MKISINYVMGPDQGVFLQPWQALVKISILTYDDNWNQMSHNDKDVAIKNLVYDTIANTTGINKFLIISSSISCQDCIIKFFDEESFLMFKIVYYGETFSHN